MMRLHNGDCLNVLKMMIEDEVFVDSIVTDPPYELGFMGRSWDSTGIAFQKETWELCFKVLKPGGHLLAFSGSRTYHRMAVAIEDAGFEIRDQVMWLYGSGFPKSMNVGKIIDKKLRGVGIGKSDPKSPLHGTKRQKIDGSNAKHDMSPLYKTQNVEYEYEHDISKQWDGWGTALKPAHEPLVLARKPLSEKSIADNVLKWGTGGINIDECRVEGNDAKYPDTNPDFRDQGRQSKENMGIDKLSFGQTENVKRKKVVRKSRDENGVWTNNNSGMKAEGSEYADADPRGRFPANIMHDGSDSIKKLFEDKSRYFYCAKTPKAERNQGLDNFPIKQTQGGGGGIGDYKDDVNSASGKFGSEKAPSKNTHPTVKPIKLMKYLCRLITPKGGTVLDPFMGSGSTGMAAKEENFEFVGIEKEEQYFNIASARIESVETKSTLEGFYD